MDQGGNIPDVLAYHIADAVRITKDNGFTVRVSNTAPPKGPGHGPLRVVRQRVTEGGKELELTVAAEDWGKEV
jgi:hypothetical protein